MKGKTRN